MAHHVRHGQREPEEEAGGYVTFGRRTVLIAGAAAVIAAAFPFVIDSPAAGPQAAGGETRAAMDRIFDALTGVFALSLDQGAFAAPAVRKRVLDDLKALDAESALLAAHGEAGSPHAFLRRSMAADARDALLRFEEADHEGAAIALRWLTANCLACHSKLPTGDGPALAGAFLDDERIARLPLEERVRLEVVSRRFDRALAGYESLLASTGSEPAEVFFMGAFEEYLKICLRVKGDTARATATLEAFARRRDVPLYLSEYVRTWLAAIKSQALSPDGGDVLARARTLIEQGVAVQIYPGDRRGLVPFIAASGLLHRYLNPPAGAAPIEAPGKCHAYYLLGLAETGISRLSWISEVEYFLETSIRTCPGTALSREAYIALEERILTSYSGSSGLDVPPDIEGRLEELERLAIPDRPERTDSAK